MDFQTGLFKNLCTLSTSTIRMFLQRKRKLCLAETLKTGTRQAVLGIRISEFRVLNGIAFDHIQKVLKFFH